MGIEVMVSSDNVLWGGLILKYVDVFELLDVFDCTLLVDLVFEVCIDVFELCFDTFAVEFWLLIIFLIGDGWCCSALRGFEIVLCIGGAFDWFDFG